jgi:nucleoside phosphorylase
MLNILVVDDNAEKMRRVLLALRESGIESQLQLHSAHDAVEAKRLLREYSYDLLVLDIALPARPDQMPRQDGGVALLEEVLTRDIYIKPKEVVGLTAFADVRDAVADRFAKDLWMVLHYDAASDEWAGQLQRKVKYMLVSQRSGPPPDYDSFVCVVTALRDPELDAVLALDWDWQSTFLPHDSTEYHHGKIVKNDESLDVYAACAPQMGMTAAAILAMKMVHAFRPRYLAMAGIAAGIRGRCELGDVIAIDPGWDWGSGKHTLENGEAVFHPAPHQIGLDVFVRDKLARMSKQSAMLGEIQSWWRGPKPRTALQIHLGPVASGAAVLQDPSLTRSIMQQHRKLLGIEMESYGVLAAAEESPRPQPIAFAIKSVCDFADLEKSDSFQHYAAYTSAEVLRRLVEEYL